MKDWQNKLEHSIKSLENQSKLLSSAVQLYNNINNLQNDIADSYLNFEESKSEFNQISEIFKENLFEFKDQINGIKETSALELKKLNESSNIFQEKFIANTKALENIITLKFEDINNITLENINLLEKKIQEHHLSNKSFQKELDTSLITRLDKHKNELEEFNKSNNTFQAEFIESTKELENIITSKFEDINNVTQKNIILLNNDIQKKIQELYQDNKNFQKELDASLISRLDKHKSDIQIDIRNEGTQIQRGLETTLNMNFNSMESKLKELFNTQSKQLNTLKILIFVTIGIGIGLLVGLYLK